MALQRCLDCPSMVWAARSSYCTPCRTKRRQQLDAARWAERMGRPPAGESEREEKRIELILARCAAERKAHRWSGGIA